MEQSKRRKNKFEQPFEGFRLLISGIRTPQPSHPIMAMICSSVQYQDKSEAENRLLQLLVLGEHAQAVPQEQSLGVPAHFLVLAPLFTFIQPLLPNQLDRPRYTRTLRLAFTTGMFRLTRSSGLAPTT